MFWFRAQRGARGGVDVEAHLLELLDNRNNLLLVGVADGDQNAALVLHLVAGRYQTLVQRLLEGLGDAQDLARWTSSPGQAGCPRRAASQS